MRPTLLLLMCLVLAVGLVPPAQSAEVPAPLQVAEDPPNDEGLAPGGAGTPVSRWAGSDLLALTVSESPAGYGFLLQVRALGGETLPVADAVSYETYFTAKDKPYGVRVFYEADQAEASGYLTEQDPEFGGFYRSVAPVGVTVDVAAGTFAWTAPRDLVLGSDGAPLFVGDHLTTFWSESSGSGGSLVEGYTLGTVEMHDRMPDADASSVPWRVSIGPEMHGPLAVRSPSPVRISNGEATTLLFEVEAKNLGDRPDTYKLAVSGAPDNWVVTFPQEESRIDAGTVQTIPVLVTVPFSHVHGTFLHFNVTVQSVSDPLTYGVVALGVRYTAVPQPSGHHDTVYLHGSGAQYINTLESDEVPEGEEAGGLPGSGGCSSSGSGETGMTELIPLFPDFDLGVDMDMQRNGTARVVMHATVPVQGTFSLGGHFLVWYGQERPDTCSLQPPEQAVAKLERSAPLTIGADEDITVELAIQPLPYADLLPRADDIHLALVLVLFEESAAHPPICCLGLEAPTFVEGSTFQLPLDEYHDPVATYFSTLSGIDLRATNEQQRLVNPGETALFLIDAESLGDGGTFDLELTGSHAEWTHVLGDTRITLGAGAHRQLAVAVTPPGDAPDGEVVDVTLHAVKQDDSNVRSLIRLLATVETDGDVPDDAQQAAEIDGTLRSKDSPGLAAGGLLAALALMAYAGRRRQAP